MSTQNYLTVLMIILASGGFGGFVFGLFTRNTYKIRIPFSGKLLEVGCIGDILVGMAASVTVFFAAGPLFNIKFDGDLAAQGFIKVIALGVLSGFTGIKLLSGMSSRLLERITAIDARLDQVETHDKVSELLRQADFLLNNNPSRALIIYDKALQIDAANEAALIGKAKALRCKERWRDALDILTQIIERNPNAERAYYNRACYKNLAPQCDKADALSDLRKAISLFDFYKDYALEDQDFKTLVNDPEFLSIVGAEQVVGAHEPDAGGKC